MTSYSDSFDAEASNRDGGWSDPDALAQLARSCGAADTRSLREIVWADGLCREVGGDFFFPEYGDHAARHAATRVCAACTVRTSCLLLALKNREEHGWWGGLSPGRRQRLLAALAKTPG